jgi:hypothetical protein
VTITRPPKLSPSILSVCFAYHALLLNTGTTLPPSRAASHPWSVPVSIFYVGEFVLSFPSIRCKSHVFWWPESLVLGVSARFLAVDNGHRHGLPLFRCLPFLSPLPHLIWSVHLISNGRCGSVPLRGVKLLKRP